MPPKTIKQALTDMLEDLSYYNLQRFCAAIQDRREEPRVRYSALEDKSRLDVANVLVSTFTEEGAFKVALETLETIGCNAEKESLAISCVSLVVPSGHAESPLSLSHSETMGAQTSNLRYGNIMKVETSGASAKTAQQDMLEYTGVKASHTMAETDLPEIKNYKAIIKNVAHEKEVDSALIAAIISRSCRGGKTLKDGKGLYDEKCFGLMQIYEVHKPRGTWNSEEHLCQGTGILIDFIIRIKDKFPNWTKEQQLKGGIAAYSVGYRNIKSYEAVDAGTPCGDYSNDVVARAQWYKSHGGF